MVQFYTQPSFLAVESPAMANCFVPVRTRKLQVQDETTTGQHQLEASSLSNIGQEGHQPINISTAQQGKLQGLPLSSNITYH